MSSTPQFQNADSEKTLKSKLQFMYLPLTSKNHYMFNLFKTAFRYIKIHLIYC